MQKSKIEHVIIIGGAGAAGLAAQTQLKRLGFKVTALDSAPQNVIGGLWSMQNPRSVIYDNLRTNLPREIMQFPSFPWKKSHLDDRQYPCHQQVKAYLEDYSKGLQVKYLKQVTCVFRQNIKQSQKWIVQTKDGEIVIGDAVVIANGQNHMAKYPQIQNSFTGRTLHSKQYRNPKIFKDQIVVILGAYASGEDLARQISSTAKKVYLVGYKHIFSDCKTPFGVGQRAHRIFNTSIKKLSNKKVILQDGNTIEQDVDTVIFATGYQFDFPFLNEQIQKDLKWDHGYVRPLYQQIAYIKDPTLFFMGIPKIVVAFPMFQIQARWIAHVLAKKIQLPIIQVMQNWLEKDKQKRGFGKKYHIMGSKLHDYYNRLLLQTNSQPMPASFKKLCYKSAQIRKRLGDTFRDVKVSIQMENEQKIFQAQQTQQNNGNI